MQFEWQFPPGVSRQLAGVAALVVAGAIGYWWFSAPGEPTPVEVTAAPAPVATRTLVVHVVGSVRSPGVFELPDGSRVLDAVEAAGGVKPGTDIAINLARPLMDGEQIVIGAKEPLGVAATAGGRIAINSATSTEIEQLPGVGPVLAERIVQYRNEHGGFRQLRDLLEVPGIGDAKYAEIAKAATL